MLCKVTLSLILAVILAAPTQAADDPVTKAEALLKTWRDSDAGPSCRSFRGVSPLGSGIEFDLAGPGAATPEFKKLSTDRSWKRLCDDHLNPLVKEGLFKAPPFCKGLDATHARCTLMTSTSLPLVLTFEITRTGLEGIVLQRIEWQRKAHNPPTLDDDDDLPM